MEAPQEEINKKKNNRDEGDNNISDSKKLKTCFYMTPEEEKMLPPRAYTFIDGHSRLSREHPLWEALNKLAAKRAAKKAAKRAAKQDRNGGKRKKKKRLVSVGKQKNKVATSTKTRKV